MRPAHQHAFLTARIKLISVFLLEAVISFAAPTVPLATSGGYAITPLNVPNGVTTTPAAINSAGQIAGSFSDSAGSHAFAYENGNFNTIDCGIVQNTTGLSISDAGIVYGVCGINMSQGYYIFRYVMATGQLTTTPVQYAPGFAVQDLFSSLTIISPVGGVFYTAQDTSNTFHVFHYQYPAGPVTEIMLPGASQSASAFILGANASGELVGSASGYFQYLNGVYSQVPGIFISGLGPAGQILGTVHQDSTTAAAVYQDGLLTELQLPGSVGQSPTPHGINAAGQIVGTFLPASNYAGLPQGFLATPIAPAANETSTLTIEAPSALAAAISGTFQVSGWAIDNVAKVTVVDLLVDGTLIGTAVPAFARPDVCAAFARQSNCPNTGWQYTANTSLLPNGPHVLQAVSISDNGKRARTSVAFSSAKGQVNPSSLKLVVESPSYGGTLSGQAVISGWAIDPGTTVSNLSVMIDWNVFSSDTPTALITPSVSRPDVCAAYLPGQVCPNAGWYYVVDTTGLANGPHTVTVIADAQNGDQTQTNVPFSVGNQGALQVVTDQPSAASGPLSGQSLISGWALDPNSKVGAVSALIDGYLQQNLYYGGYRADVCAAYPSGLNCPGVGWSGFVDTTQLSNGKHTLSIAANAQNNDRLTTAPVAFTVNNPVAGNTTRVVIEQPGASADQVWGQQPLSGWALDDVTPIKTLTFLIDGAPVSTTDGTYLPRPDVCAVYPNRPGCPNVGWTNSINTSALSNGTHMLTVVALSQAGSQAMTSVSFNVNNVPAAASTRLAVEAPAASAAVAGTLVVSGWSLNEYTRISTVGVSIDGGPVQSARYGALRNDVCQAFPDAPGCPNVGWYLPLDTATLANGVHRLNVIAAPLNSSFGAGTSQSLFFTVNNTPASSPILTYIESPAANAALSGVVSVSGWSIDPNALISDVAVTVDGVPFGVAAYGASRPDVCSAYPSYAGCPAAALGWYFLLDTGALANGPHMLAITAASADGQFATATSSFSSAN